LAKKSRQHFLCNQCGSSQTKWFGKCPDCGTWDSLEPYTPPTEDDRAASIAAPMDVGTVADADITQGATPLSFEEIELTKEPRFPTGIGELDRVLGGGIVPGAAILVGGEPGIGKSTLLLQMAGVLAGATPPPTTDDLVKPVKPPLKHVLPDLPVLYVTSEESARQTKMRGQRLGIDRGKLLVLAETNLDRIVHQIHRTKAKIVVIDSVQMIYRPDIPAAPGSVTQLRDCCTRLVYLAKQSGVAIIFVGHVTKAGTLAGPKIVEHVVDAVLYFEGDRYHAHRIVRCIKNRFGSTQEVGLFEMTGGGLLQVSDPGQLFVRPYGNEGPPSGSVLTCAMQGSRCLMVEVQALTNNSVVGAARRKVSGVSSDRVAMILAVLEKRCELRLADQDVYVNIAGGVKVIEPGIDLAIAMAIASAHMNRALPPGTLAVGELGLGGEVRSVAQLEQRLREGARLGVGQAVIPHAAGPVPSLGGVALRPVRRLQQALGEL
jgi:DNA repair protein RadA/Sms